MGAGRGVRAGARLWLCCCAGNAGNARGGFDAMFACLQHRGGSRATFRDTLFIADYCRDAALGKSRMGDEMFLDCARDGGLRLVCGPPFWQRVDSVLAEFWCNKMLRWALLAFLKQGLNIARSAGHARHT